VPTARRIERARAIVSVGTIMNPPPTPKKPVSAPTVNPAARSRPSLSGGHTTCAEAGVREAADHGAGCDHHQRRRGCLVDVLAEDVDEHRDGQDGSAAAEHPEAEADSEPEWDRSER
jgi:hypothetical protein